MFCDGKWWNQYNLDHTDHSEIIGKQHIDINVYVPCSFFFIFYVLLKQ